MDSWLKLFNLSFFIGLSISFVVMTLISYIWPPQGLGEEAPFVEQVEGSPGSTESPYTEETSQDNNNVAEETLKQIQRV